MSFHGSLDLSFRSSLGVPQALAKKGQRSLFPFLLLCILHCPGGLKEPVGQSFFSGFEFRLRSSFPPFKVCFRLSFRAVGFTPSAITRSEEQNPTSPFWPHLSSRDAVFSFEPQSSASAKVNGGGVRAWFWLECSAA